MMNNATGILAALVLLLQVFSFAFSHQEVQAQESAVFKISSMLALQVQTKLNIMEAGGIRDDTDEPSQAGFLNLFQEHIIDPGNLESQQVFVHFKHEPSPEQITELESMGLAVYPETWVPPVGSHPTGFMMADMPLESLEALSSREYIARLETAERRLEPHNDLGAQKMLVNNVWNAGYNGSGIRIAVLDSGLDMTHADIPAPVGYKDYSNYDGTPASLDDTLANTVTGHGTHVAGSVLGRGTRSSGVYKGSAPGAELVFLKIGKDGSGSATTSAMVGAMKAAVDVYNADIITMSYGGWDAFHDGSSEESQAVDYAVSRGAAVLISAGNKANDSHHCSGTVPANSTTGSIQVNVTGAAASDTLLFFNLVWFDGPGVTNDLNIRLFDSSNVEITDFVRSSIDGSSRGTQSRLGIYGTLIGDQVIPSTVPQGNSTWYLKIDNSSGNPQDFHIYYMLGNYKVKFQNADPLYTVCSPADADSAIAVGACTTRKVWFDFANNGYQWINETVDTISSFSSRGPRVDAGAPPKISISAPGCGIISSRDNDVYPWANRNPYYIDNDGPNTSNPAANNGAGPADYYMMQGTSMACPLAAGAAALLLDKYPDLTPAQVRHLFERSASDKGDPGHDSIYGWGLLDIQTAANLTLPTFVSYSDSAHLTPDDSFIPGNTVYSFSGSGWLLRNHDYQVAWYDGIGNRVFAENISSDSSRNLSAQYTFTGLEEIGTWHAVISEKWFSPPVTYTSGWAYTLSTDNFTLSNAAPPAVSTAAATAVTTSSATLNGSLDSLGDFTSANVSFEWGTTSGSLNQTTPPQLKSSPGSFAAPISGLTQNTQYFFRAKAVAGSDNISGNESSFTTLSPLTFLSAAPSPNSLDAPASSSIEMKFSSSVNSSTISENTLRVHGSLSGTVNGTRSVTGANVTFNPDTNLNAGETISVTLTNSIQGYGAGNLINPTVFQFIVRVPSGYKRFADTGQTLGNTYTQGVELGDLDGDGDLDAFTANIAGQASKVWFNNGSANFTDSGQNPGSGTYSYDVALGDVDDDGDLDAFLLNYSGSGGAPDSVWLNNGSGSFTSNGQSLGNSDSHGVALGDLDGDGDLDAFVANFNSQPNRVWFNDGSGIFTDSGQSLGTDTSNDVALGDIDGDGDLDAFVANTNANKVYLNNGSGIFTGSGQSLGNSNSTDVALADLDGDGDLDAFVTNTVFAADRVWLNNGSGTFTTNGQSLGSTYSQGVRLGDLDGDGDLDAFVTVSSASGEPNLVWINDGSGNFTDSGLRLGNSRSYCVALGDLDGDGDLDAFVANNLNEPDTVWLNKSDVVAETSLSEGLDTQGIAVVRVKIDRIKNPSDNSTVSIPGGLGSYTAALSAPDGGMEILEVRGIAPFENLVYNPATGVFSAENLTSGVQPAGTIIAELVVKLTGNCSAYHPLNIQFTSITAAGSGSAIPAEKLNTITFRRGDANNDGIVNIGDSLIIAQYIVGQKTLDQLKILNAAGVSHEPSEGDIPGIGDALFIAQYIVGQKNCYFQ